MSVCEERSGIVRYSLNWSTHWARPGEETQLCVSRYWRWCILLLWISNLSISSLFMLQFGHVRKNVCGCQVSRFRVYNLLVTCQVKVCAKFSFSCDEEVIEEDVLRTSQASPLSTSTGMWQLSCALKRKFSKARRAKFLQKSPRFSLTFDIDHLHILQSSNNQSSTFLKSPTPWACGLLGELSSLVTITAHSFCMCVLVSLVHFLQDY